ncbi:hypothetical protein F5Y16DRAFT_372358 [Xylariaceae sp. FL0255]|nr:hypothetical protein F5Y16DRAFT_372358 [Xylariaceae sp. FL0255]
MIPQSSSNPVNMSLTQPATLHYPLVMSRPQVGIERLPTRRMSNEPRESMNCKSCRKRKIKCNRLRPSCEACQVFQCPCVYDAVPKKRGPKTDVLEALLKRVDGLEAQLKDKKDTGVSSPTTEEVPSTTKAETADGGNVLPSSPSTSPAPEVASAPKGKRVMVDIPRGSKANISDDVLFSPAAPSEISPGVQLDALLDIYFSRIHAKPYYILDESLVRQRLQLHQLPMSLLYAIYAVSARHSHHTTGYQSAVKLSEEFAARSRKELDTDDPSFDSLQTLLLLVVAYIAAGKGKKAYMLLTTAIGMAMALELHREVDTNAPIVAVEVEMRRHLFWSCYLMDRFMACGSKRPCLISDKIIFLRLPCWTPTPGGIPIEGDFFQSSLNFHYLQGSGKRFQGGSGMLIDISRILGVTNRYLASGGVKGDSHFPWHTLSSLSKIRQDLDIWASGTDDVFSSVETLFGHPESTVLVLSKLIYHLIHCLIYRPFLPIELAELAVSGQHQSWQIEATNMCFLHANAITELVQLGKQASSTEWPAFVGYCLCTAGTVHIHGAHYNKTDMRGGDTAVLAASADFLSREMQQLSQLRYAWASVQHQRDTLQNVYSAHAELVKNVAGSSLRYLPAFNLENFFSRYANVRGPNGEPFVFDAANLSLTDVTTDFATDTYTGHDLYAPRSSGERTSTKRKFMENLTIDLDALGTVTNGSRVASALPTPDINSRRLSFATRSQTSQMLRTSKPIPSHLEGQSVSRARMADPGTSGTGGFSMATPRQLQHLPPGFPATPYHVANNLPSGEQNSNPHSNGPDLGSFDPIFGGMPTNAISSPAPWQGNGGDTKETAVEVSGTSPAKSQSHAASTPHGTVDEKDPFLSLLEQLADSEQATGQGSELDFFLAGVQD